MGNTESFQWDRSLVIELLTEVVVQSHRNQRITYGEAIDKFIESKQLKKDWEILSVLTLCFGVRDVLFTRSEGSEVFTPPKGHSGGFFTFDELSRNGCKIHSVRRLSDKEVFTIGDMVKVNGIKPSPLRDLSVYEGNMMANSTNVSALLMYFNKVEVPLFITSDGKSVYAGDKIWYVAPDLYIGESTAIKNESGVYWPSAKVFSTKGLAQKYVLENTPLLSIMEVDKVLSSFGANSGIIDKLKELVKSKP